MPSTAVDSNFQNNSDPDAAVLDALIIGAGPAGASLAAFLTSHGVKGVMINKNPSVADTPRAHLTNMATLDCLRDIGLDDECTKLASPNDCIQHLRFCHSMAGREYARIYSWGHDPKLKGAYEAASPCRHIDLPQPLLEPVLLRYATLRGFQCRFDTEFVAFREEGGVVTTTVFDRISKQTYQLRSRFLFGADGGRSKVVQQLGLPLARQPDQGVAINVLVTADLSHLMGTRKGNLHWIMQSDHEPSVISGFGAVRMVKPWKEWLFGMRLLPAAKDRMPTHEDYMKRVRDFIGDDTPAEITGISPWTIQEVIATTFSSGSVFCLGDAVHRHPPFNGLGSNTSIQDSFNLAWKIAYVLQGRATHALLASYSVERQPVGVAVVARANQANRDNQRTFTVIGMGAPTVLERMAALSELGADSDAGRARRRQFQDAVAWTSHEVHALGIEMNQQYQSGAVCEEDEDVQETVEDRTTDPVLYYVPSTYPGRRLPHVWLSEAVPSGLVSTIDIAGKGGFTLLTGIGGGGWKAVASAVAEELQVPIRVCSIGFGQEYEDIYFDWERVRGVEESGCILARPDRFVAWRAKEFTGRGEGWAEKRLREVMRSVLGWP